MVKVLVLVVDEVCEVDWTTQTGLGPGQGKVTRPPVMQHRRGKDLLVSVKSYSYTYIKKQA